MIDNEKNETRKNENHFTLPQSVKALRFFAPYRLFMGGCIVESKKNDQ